MASIEVSLIDHLGSDLTVVNAARVSFGKHKEELDRTDTKLIKYLSGHNHWSPFAHCMITLRETVPIFVARQRFKHMVGFTYNEVSRRYVDSPPEFYVPEVWRSRPEGSVKQGSGEVEVDSVVFMGQRRYLETVYGDYLDYVEDLYESLLAGGVAPEMARMVLPQSMMTSYYVTGSLAAFARAHKQRIDPHAQLEIQELAKKWDEIIRPLFPYAWKEMTSDTEA